jgi:hypothetical protein
MHRNPGRGFVDFTEIVRCQLDRNGSDVLFQAIQFCGAWNGDERWFLMPQKRISICTSCSVGLRRGIMVEASGDVALAAE